MAELGESGDVHSSRGKKRGGVRAKKLSTRIDMTPMVDLGFLLVTFFILTTTMQRPKAMPVIIPEKPKEIIDTTKIREPEAMTVILGSKDRIFYYFGITDPKVEATTYSKIRKILIDKNKEVLELQRQKGWKENGVNVLLKPSDESTYQNLVDLLDELKVTDIKVYAIMDLMPEELEMIPK